MASTFNANIGSVTVSQTSGNVLVVDTNVLVVDATNNRVGIGTASPTALLDVNGNINMSGKILNLTTPTAATDAATKGYVDSVAAGLDVRGSVRAATTANITLSAPQTIDGVSVIAGDRVLVKNQSTGSENGIYVCAAGAWSRSTDADEDAEVTSGMFCFVSEGTANADTGWVLTTNDPITVGSTSLSFTQFNGAGSLSLTTIGSSPNANGATLSSNILNLEPASASFGGVVTTGTQTLAGAKTFSSALTVSSTSGNVLIVDTNVLVADATNDRVGINNASPSVALDVTGAGKFSGDLTVDTDVLAVDTANNRVGVNVASPTVALDVSGEAKASTGFLIAAQKIRNGSAAPVAGTWAQGDIVFNTAPAAGGSIGWVCTTAGTPGTWKEFGLIST